MQHAPAFATAVLASALILSCGDGGSPPTAPTPTTPTGPAPTPPATPSSAFGPGTHLVGQDIAARRYFSDPGSGCFWERLSGLGGTLAETIANQFIGFDARQEIVAVAPGDVAFSADGDCGDWFTTPRHGAQTGIPPGRWLVGAQVAPGTYRVNASGGCYWERVRNFSGEISGIIANDFVPNAGQQLVTIAPGDLGFYTDGDCGTWSRAATSRTTEPTGAAQTPGEIERNRRLSREGAPLP